METRDDVLIVGAGVIGLASALALLRAGRGVRVLESGSAGCGSSHGNCGTITPSHAPPLTAPGAVARALRWMAAPDAPFYVKPRFDPALWGWMLRFAARCNRRDWRAATSARAAILDASRTALPDWIARYGLDCEFEASGVDYVFRDAAELEAFDEDLQLLAGIGVPTEVIDGDAYVRDEPALLPGVAGVVRFPGDARLRPNRYVAELARAVRGAGGTIVEQCEVTALAADGSGAAVTARDRQFRGRDLLLATGAWSPKLARGLGLRVPVQPGKGYSITYSRPALVPKRPLVLRERSVCVTAWDSGYRLGSTMEFSGYDSSLNRRRLAALERGAREYLREPVGPSVEEKWYGWRPLSCDDLPIIGRARGHRRAWLATGHGMLGVSMSAATGQLIAELMCGRPPHIDPAPYDPARFG
ncbi:FAD-dependent oxidoreductase [Luteimonas sp. RD2P54]|uniref:FAD-dependent oxidoreductase n=1 Tax=Luteimonas endophytica TaxID=3042023 RepID=A0ABT6JC60_9GAMM|nr:FAD-dependent oxidoreductase [Luteimonas endophytica]MDH5824412.1 FAD-dependent oxidoreductase [Luteimonas endophytica]